MQDDAPVIRVGDLYKTYGNGKGGTRALKGLTLEVGAGEFLSLIGPDGAGKTTLIKILCGMIPFDSGAVEILGRLLPAGAGEIKRRMGYLSQRFSLYGNLSVEENVTYFARIFGVDGYRTRMERLLDSMNLARFRTRLAKKLSGGMKQKLGVICGLIHSPEIMLLDEPTTGVDPVSRRELFNVVEEMVSEGLTVLMSTAYMDEAERADRVVMLHEGSLLEAGTVAELRRSSGCAVREITTSNPAAAVDRLRGERWTRFVNPVGATVRHISDSSAEDGLVAGALRGLDAKTARVPPTMEDLFINRLLEREARPAGQG